MAICYFDKYCRGRRMVFLPAAGAPLVRRRRDRDPASTGIRLLDGQRAATGPALRMRELGAILGRRRPRRHADRPAPGERDSPGDSASPGGYPPGTPQCRRLVRPAQSARLAAGPGPPGRLHPGVVRGGRTSRRGLALVLPAPWLRGRLPAAAADLRGGRRGADHPGPAGHRHPGGAAAQDRAARRGGGGGGPHRRRRAGAGAGAGYRIRSSTVRRGLRRPLPDSGRAGRASCAGCGATERPYSRASAGKAADLAGLPGPKACTGRPDGRGAVAVAPAPGRTTATAWPRAATTRPPPGRPAASRGT